MGRPHCGSTIIDILIGNSAEVESVGELVSGLSREASGEVCACGRTMLECPYWDRVREEFERDDVMSWAELRTSSVAQAHVRKLPQVVAATYGAHGLRSLGESTSRLGQVIAATAGKKHVLDSSKEPTRALMVLRFCPDSCAIHLVRDPRDAVASHYRRFRKQGGYFRFLRRTYFAPSMLVPFMLLAAASWTIGNIICELVRRFAPGRTIRIRYEDFCDHPAAEIRRVGAAFAIPLEDLVDRIETGRKLEIGHNVGGNQIRRGDKVAFDPERGKGQDLPRWLELATLVLCWPVMIAYGYPLRAQPTSSAGVHER